jgi:hypothetical protein
LRNSLPDCNGGVDAKNPPLRMSKARAAAKAPVQSAQIISLESREGGFTCLLVLGPDRRELP